jgi:hypothetical protein
MAENSPKSPAPFLLLFRNAGPDVHAHLTPEQKTAKAKEWNDWVELLVAQGKLQHGYPLGLGSRLVSGVAGERVTDGPFPETKEVVGGFLFLTVADMDEATAIAQQCPGLPQGLMVEIRPIMDHSPALTEVRARPLGT